MKQSGEGYVVGCKECGQSEWWEWKRVIDGSWSGPVGIVKCPVLHSRVGAWGGIVVKALRY
jgi:hypothetical protein